MTVPDSPSLMDVIADALLMPENVPCPVCHAEVGIDCSRPWTDIPHRERQAAAVVARCQGLTVAQQAELVCGVVVRGDLGSRVVGHWREDPS